jgi:uncharacterized protein (TIGR03435 family)
VTKRGLRSRQMVAVALVVGCGLTVNAQGRRAKEPSLDVVSVRSVPAGTTTSSQNVVGNRLDYRNVRLDRIIVSAMAESRYLIEGIPEWTARETFDIAFTTAERLEPPDVNGLFRQVLETRFALKWHRETRRVPIYALRRMDGDTLGPGLAAIDKDCAVDLVTRIAPCRFAVRSDGTKSGETRWSTLSGLIKAAAGAERPVFDRTGLTGSFRVEAKWTVRPDVDIELPTIFTAVREQLGLRLEPRVEAVEMVVIDSVGRPTPN